MTEAPTMALNTAEWRGLVLVNIQQLHTFVNGVEAPTAEQVTGMFQHVDRMKFQMRAWQASAPAPAAVEADAPKTNGAAPKQRGWPKGRKRTPRADQASVQ